MLLSDEVDVSLIQNNIGYYRKMGYGDIMPTYKDDHYRIKVKVGTIIKVKVKDLPRYSNIQIPFKCDYCGKDFCKSAQNYFNTLEKDLPIKKDCCDDCRQFKLQECNEIRFGGKSPFSSQDVQNKATESIYNIYGVDNVFQNEDIKNMIIENNIKLYGVKYSMQRQEVKDKMEQTNMERYGVHHAMQNKEISAKVRETLFKNGTAPRSKQQIYVHQLIGGKINYPYYNASLDIAFPEEKFYVECDFGGHWLSIKLGGLTQDAFDKKQRNRWYSLYRSGWKSINIISRNDNLPSDTKIIEILSYARTYLKNHHYIKFDIDNNKIINSQGEFDFYYGELRKIKLTDLKKAI